MIEPLARETQKLYALPRAEFTAARNARAKALRRDDSALAAAVPALPKPNLAAALLNGLVRDDPSEVRALVQSRKRLRRQAKAGCARGGRRTRVVGPARRGARRGRGRAARKALGKV